MNKRLELTETFFKKDVEKIIWTQHMSNDKDLDKMSTKTILKFSIRKKQLKVLGHVIRKAGLNT